MSEDCSKLIVRKPCPGDVFFDRTGCVSHSVPATYVVLSGEPANDRHNGWEYRCWCARACNDGWMGGPVTIMWDTDLARLEHVGQVPMGHLANDGAASLVRSAALLGSDGLPWPQTFDGQTWAKEFVRHVQARPEIASDEGTMTGWFANAIMVGYDRAKQKPSKEMTR